MSAPLSARMTVADYAKLAQPIVEANNWQTPHHLLSRHPDTVQFHENPNQNLNNYQSNFNSGWRNNPGLDWTNQNQNQSLFQNSGQNFSQYSRENKPTLEDMMIQQSQLLSKFIERTETTFQNDQLKSNERDAHIHHQKAALQSLEKTVSQLVERMLERTNGDLPNAVSTRSSRGTEVEEPVGAEDEPVAEVQDKESTPGHVHANSLAIIAQPLESDKKAQSMELCKPHIPYPAPKCVEFLKVMLPNITKLEKLSTMVFTAECSAVLQDKLPQKIAEPGSFSIPFLLGDISISNTFVDLGASINAMTYTVFHKLDLGEPQTTYMNLLLAVQSVKYPRGFIQVMNFFMYKDVHFPIILGQLLVTNRALIKTFAGVLTIRMKDDQLIYTHVNK